MKEKTQSGKGKAGIRIHDAAAVVLPGAVRSDSALSQQLRQKYGLQSYPQLLLVLVEALVFRREIDYRDLDAYYDIRPPV